MAELSTAASLVPVMVTCTVVGVPSALVTVKVSLTLSPTFEVVEGRAGGVTPDSGRVDAEGAEVALRAALRDEARLAVDIADGERAPGGEQPHRSPSGGSPPSSAPPASLVPVMVTCTVVGVPSALVTVKVSLTLSLTLRSSKAEPAV